MAGSSALTKLKANLHSTNSASNSRTNKSSKTRSSVSQSYRSLKNGEAAAKLNSFDTIEERKKFKVVTRSGKLEKGLVKNEPGKSRAAGIELVRSLILAVLPVWRGCRMLTAMHDTTSENGRFCRSCSLETTPRPSSTIALANLLRPISLSRRRRWNDSPPSVHLVSPRHHASTSRTATMTAAAAAMQVSRTAEGN